MGGWFCSVAPLSLSSDLWQQHITHCRDYKETVNENLENTRAIYADERGAAANKDSLF